MATRRASARRAVAARSDEVTRTPVSIVPPWRSMSAASAAAMACDPPSATTHPLAWAGGDQHQPDGARQRPIESSEGVGGDRRPTAPWPARCAKPRTSTSAGSRRRHRIAPASADGVGSAGAAARRRRTGRRSAPLGGPNTWRHRATVAPEVRRRSDRSTGTGRRPTRRRADARSRPPAAATSARPTRGPSSSKNGDPAAIGWNAEQ